MEWTLGTSVALISCLYISLFTTPASGKCSDAKSLHHCYGGNGKRSDPSLRLSPSSSLSGKSLSLHLRRNPNLLSKILISDDIDRLTGSRADKTWPESVQNYFPSPYPDSSDDVNTLRSRRADDREEEENPYRTRLELALTEVEGLRKYIAILERLLRASSTNLA